MEAGEIWKYRLTIWPDGTRTQDRIGSWMVETPDGPRPVHPQDQIGPDGNVYGAAAMGFQDEEDGPVVHVDTLRIIATAEELERSRAPMPPPPADILVDAPVREWLAGPTQDRRALSLTLRDDPFFMPHVPPASEVDAEVWLDATERRALAIEARKSYADELVAPVVAALNDQGIDWTGPDWRNPGVVLWAAPDDVRPWVEDSRVSAIGFIAHSPQGMTGKEIRTVHQIDLHTTGGFTGDHETERSASSKIYIGVADTQLDTNHPALSDALAGSSPSRVVHNAYNSTLNTWVSTSNTAVSGSGAVNHGTYVTMNLAADLQDGQDPTVIGTTNRQERSGTSPNSKVYFLEYADTLYLHTLASRFADWNVDIINNSNIFDDGLPCSRSHSQHEPVNNAVIDGAFWVNSTRNELSWPAGVCQVNAPATAAGAFAVNALDDANVTLPNMQVVSGQRGGMLVAAGGSATATWNIVGLTAAGGNLTEVPQYDDSYGAPPFWNQAATSFATPIVAGAAANVLDHLASVLPATPTNVHTLYPLMLLMGDRERAYSTGLGTPIWNETSDSLWGAGRLRARLFTAEGMDGPWSYGLIDTVIHDGDGDTNGNVIIGTIGAPVPANADVLKGAYWWFEPNLDSAAAVANLSGGFIKPASTLVRLGSKEVNRARIILRQQDGNDPGGSDWSSLIRVHDVPASVDPEYYHGLSLRRVQGAWFYEDNARDDANGPTASQVAVE